MTLKRPILIGGLGLSASLWLLNIVGHSPLGHAFDGSTMVAAVGIGAGLWWMKQRSGSGGSVIVEPPLAIGPVEKGAIEKVIAAVESSLETLVAEMSEETRENESLPVWTQVTEQRESIEQLRTNLERETLTLSVLGNKATGKSTIVEQLNTSWKAGWPTVTSIAEVTGETAMPESNADLVLLVTAADLTQSELERIRTLLKEGYRVQLAFNKQDQLAPMDRQSVLTRIQTRVENLGIDVRAIAANPNPITVRRPQEDGTVQEFTEQPEPQLGKLTDRLNHLIENETQQLVWTTTLRQANALLSRTHDLLNSQRRERAMPIVEQMQWIAAGSAFASPLPSLDLLASTAINAQLIVDLGAVYGQTFSIDQAKAAAGTLAELLVKLGLVELSTQALGSVLKTHFATYVAGGVIQGISAAYLTRVVGKSLIDFFEEQSLLAPEKQKFAFSEMGDRLQTLFKATKQGLNLQTFVQQTLTHLPGLAQQSGQPKTASA